jgi:hypothetical protein
MAEEVISQLLVCSAPQIEQLETINQKLRNYWMNEQEFSIFRLLATQKVVAATSVDNSGVGLSQ